MVVTIPPKVLRLHYHPDHGWLLDVPMGYPAELAQRAIDWALKIQRDRWRSAPHGERREDIGRGIRELEAGKWSQHVVGARGDGSGDILLFSGTKGI